MSIEQASMTLMPTGLTAYAPLQTITTTTTTATAEPTLPASAPIITTDAISAVISGGKLVNGAVYYGGSWYDGYWSQGVWIEPSYVGGVACSKGKSDTFYCPIGGTATTPYTTMTFDVTAAAASMQSSQAAAAASSTSDANKAFSTDSLILETGSASFGIGLTRFHLPFLAVMLLTACLA